MKNAGKILAFVMLIQFFGCSGGSNKNSIQASGNIEATNVIVSAKVGGQIEKLNFIEGDYVKKGDTLLVLDSESFKIQLQQAEANRKLAEAQLQLLRNGARKEDIMQAEALLRQAEINLEQAKKDKERIVKLYSEKSVTQKQYEDTISKFDLMEQQHKSAKENYDKLKNFARPEELRQAEARVQLAKASEDLIRKNIRDSYVVSPLNGFIVKKFFEKGETVMPMASLLKISDLSLVNLVIYVSEEELGKVKLGQSVNVSVDAYKGKTFPGKVIYISPEAEFTPKNIQTKDERTKLVFAVKVEIKNPDFDLKPGMPADAVIRF